MLVNLAGTVEMPAIDGQAILEEGAYTDEVTGFSLVGLHVEANAINNANGSQVSFNGGARGVTQTGDDRLTVEGKLGIGEKSLIDLTIGLNELAVSAVPVESLVTSGTIDISGALDAMNITGSINLSEMNVEIITPPQTGLINIRVVEQISPSPVIDSSIKDSLDIYALEHDTQLNDSLKANEEGEAVPTGHR